MTNITLRYLIIPTGGFIGIPHNNVDQTITISLGNTVRNLHAQIQQQLPQPFRNVLFYLRAFRPGPIRYVAMREGGNLISDFFDENIPIDGHHILVEEDVYEQNLKLDDDDLGILRNEKITSQDFLDMTEEKFRSYGLKGGPAMRLAKEVQTLREKPKRAFSSYLSLSEVLAEYGHDSDGIDSIPFFSPPTYEIQDDNKVSKRCMEEILGRLRSYGTLQPDSLEAMLGEESRGRVDYAIKEAEDLICITEDKQHKVPIGFAQNIKQLESACETNKRKRKRGDNAFDYLYGIVTTGRDWHFLLYSPEKYPRQVILHT
ncbi:hypothetical protein GLOIN_2v1695250 [Rhizophagus clarus]|uniref:SAM domain-containing protein n=1 Tax=Rhizophagus clarus TaxID=94130 RepID=A0A8H3QWG9_9GLOM|nr:hypothetical protein GLOIN_2v1695250 [Rhizophagus clarus]